MDHSASRGLLRQQTSVMTLLSVILTLTLLVTATLAQDHCQLLVVRENIVYTHGDWTCQKVVTLNKCEGQCESNVTPSVREHQGFKKVCPC
jgi:hypothetical protein